MIRAMALTSDRSDDHLRRLGALVQQRRAVLEWSIARAAEEAGIAYMTYQRVERAQGVQQSTYAKLERAFGFRPGSCRAVLDGATSIALLDGSEIVEGGRLTPIRPEDMAEEVRDAVTSATIATVPGLTGKEIKALNDEVLRELQRRGILSSDD